MTAGAATAPVLVAVAALGLSATGASARSLLVSELHRAHRVVVRCGRRQVAGRRLRAHRRLILRIACSRPPHVAVD